jgi:hypothetical protein
LAGVREPADAARGFELDAQRLGRRRAELALRARRGAGGDPVVRLFPHGQTNGMHSSRRARRLCRDRGQTQRPAGIRGASL